MGEYDRITGSQIATDPSYRPDPISETRKFNRGWHLEQRWIFGGVCPEQGCGFIQFVPDRSRETLDPIIMPAKIVTKVAFRQSTELAGCLVRADAPSILSCPFANIAKDPTCPLNSSLSHRSPFPDLVTATSWIVCILWPMGSLTVSDTCVHQHIWIWLLTPNLIVV